MGINGDGLNVGQLLSFKDVNESELKSLTEEIQSISNADYGAFDALKIQEYANALSDLEPKQAALLLSTQGLSNAQIEQTLSAQKLTPELINQAMLEAGLLSSKQKLTTAQIEETLQTVLGSDADTQATMSAMELKVATDAQGNSVAKLTKRNIEAAIASGKLTQEQALQLASMLGLNMSVKKQASSTLPKWIATLKLSAKAIWENITATVTWLATNPAGWAILAVTAIVGVTAAVSKNAKSVKESVDKMVDSYDESQKTLQSHKNTIDGIKDKYEALSKGVDELGNNVSLTTDQYKEYIDICNQIADMYPSLVSGYTSEGNAILKLKGNVDALTKAYKDEQKAAAASIISGSDDDNKNVVKNYKNQNKTSVKQAFSAAFTFDSDKATVKGLTNQQKINYLNKALSMSKDSLKNYSGSIGQDTNFRSLLKVYGLDPKSTDDAINTAISNMKADLATYQAELDDSMKGIKTKAKAYMVYNNEYDNLSEDQQKQVSTLIDGITTDVADKFKKDSDINGYVQKVIDAISNKESDVSRAYRKLLSIDPNDMQNVQKDKENIDSYIGTIADYIGTDVDSLKKTLGYDTADVISEQYQNIIDSAKEKFNSDEDKNFDWDSWFEEHSVNTQEEIDKWKEIAQSADNATEARKKYVQVVGSYKDTDFFNMGTDEAKSKLGELSSQLDKIQSAYSTLSSAVTEYNADGKLSIDTMQSIISLGDNWLDYIDMESGAFTLDQDALDKLTQSRIEDMKQQSLANLVSNVESIQNEADVTKYLSSTNYDAANSYEELAKEKLADVQATLQQKLDSGDISQDSYDKVIKKFESDAQKIQQIFDNTSFKLTADGSTADTYSSLENHAKLLKTVQDELKNTNSLSSSTLSSISQSFPELNSAVQKFRDEMISSDELFSQLEQAYQDDADAYKASEENKYMYTTDFWNEITSGNEELQQALTNFYGNDWKNWKNLAIAKQQCDSKLIQRLGDMWDKYYEAQSAAFKITQDAEGNYYTETNEDAPIYQPSPLGNGMTAFNGMKKDLQNQANEDRQKVDEILGQFNLARQKIKEAAEAAAPSLTFDNDWHSIGGDSSSSSSSSQTAEKLNWIERLINKISTAYSRLKNIVSDTTTTWLKRNNALVDSMSTLRDEINAQSDAYEYYMNAFNSYGLDDYYKNQIADGSISIDVIYDDDLKDAISDCQDFYDKAQDAKTAVQELNIELKGLAKSRFDNVASEFEKKISYFKDYSDQLQKEMDIITTKGWFSSTSINEELKKVEQDNLDRLKQERDTLMNALNSAVDSGKIEKYSEDWYDMQSSIDSVTSSILDAEKALIEYDNAIRQIKWDAFDRTRDDVENLISETEFLVELLKDKGITDDNGNTTAEGKAAQALLVQKYQLYLNQAQKYKDEILKIDEELANNPYDKELLDRKQDLIDKQQEAIKSSISEKDAIKDLVNDGYNDLLDALQKVIDKQKESLNAEKSLHDYQRTVAEQANTVAQLQKRLLALQGDDSESGQSQRQSISSELKDAQDKLQETEYEQYIEDQTKMLDDLASQAEEWINTRLDNLDGLIQQIIDDSNTHSGDIKDTITNTANEFGVNLSDGMKSIWETNTNNINNNITSVFNDFGTKFDNTMTTLNNVVSGIESKVQEMLRIANEEAAQRQAELEEQRKQQEAAESNSSSSSDYSEPDYDWDDIGGGDSGSSSGDGVDWIYEENYYPRDLLNIDQSVVDRLKYNNFASDFGARSQYYEQMGGDGQYTGSYDQNVWMLDYLKNHGYKNGTKSATAGLHRTDEEGLGSEVIFSKKYGTLRKLDAGDMVFDKERVENLWNLSSIMPNMFTDNLGAKLPDITSVSSSKSVDIGGINVNVDKVVTDNPEDFTRQLTNELAGNSKIQKILGEINSNQLLGRNSLSTRRYMK